MNVLNLDVIVKVLVSQPNSSILKLQHIEFYKSQVTNSNTMSVDITCTLHVQHITFWQVMVAQVEAHRTTDREVMGLIPTGSRAFF